MDILGQRLVFCVIGQVFRKKAWTRHALRVCSIIDKAIWLWLMRFTNYSWATVYKEKLCFEFLNFYLDVNFRIFYSTSKWTIIFMIHYINQTACFTKLKDNLAGKTVGGTYTAISYNHGVTCTRC